MAGVWLIAERRLWAIRLLERTLAAEPRGSVTRIRPPARLSPMLHCNVWWEARFHSGVKQLLPAD
jgi:hypothetical protein